MQHQEILDKIEIIKEFFESIDLKQLSDFKKTWDLDSYIKFEPIKNNYIINYKGEDRVLLNVNIYIAGGLHFVLSGKIGVSVFETISTDYDFKCKYEEGNFLKHEFRDYRLKKVLY